MNIQNVTNDGKNLVVKITSTVAQFKEIARLREQANFTLSYDDKLTSKDDDTEVTYIISGPLKMIEGLVWLQSENPEDTDIITVFKSALRSII